MNEKSIFYGTTIPQHSSTQMNVKQEQNKKPVEQIVKKFNLMIIVQNGKMLLGMKKRGFATGKYNGFGGKIESNETVHQSMERELMEEAGIQALHSRFVGFLLFLMGDQAKPEQQLWFHVHVFTANKYEGEVTESEEMRPQWFDQNKLPFQEMWLDDQHWMPFLIKGASFYGEFIYEGHEHIVKSEVFEVDQQQLIEIQSTISNIQL